MPTTDTPVLDMIEAGIPRAAVFGAIATAAHMEQVSYGTPEFLNEVAIVDLLEDGIPGSAVLDAVSLLDSWS